MFADLSHTTSTSGVHSVAWFFWRLSRAFEPKGSHRLPAELRRLSEYQLRDIGVDPRSLYSSLDSATPLELLRRQWP